jgi:predicted amidohydrolase
MTVRMSVVQLDCSDAEPPAARVDRVLNLLDELGENSDFVLLPELWNAGAFNLELNRSISQKIDGPLPTALSEKARKFGMWLHGGSFCESDGDSLFNTSVLFNPSGDLVAKYRKVHVFTYAREQEVMTPGDQYVVIKTPLGLTGLATCYDARFPEMFRAMRTAGAQAFLIPSGWPTKRIDQWKALLPARAVENQAWVIANNQVGVQGEHQLGGSSAIIDPLGSIQESGGCSEEVFSSHIDPDLAVKWRTEFPTINDIVEMPVVIS